MKIRPFIIKIRRKYDNYRRLIDRTINRLHLIINGVEADRTVVVAGRLFIRNEGEIFLGVNVKINSANWANPIGGLDKTYFQIMRGGY